MSDGREVRLYLFRIHLLTSCSQFPFIVEATKAMGSFTYPDHKGPAVNMEIKCLLVQKSKSDG